MSFVLMQVEIQRKLNSKIINLISICSLTSKIEIKTCKHKEIYSSQFYEIIGRDVENIKSLGKAEVFFIRVANSAFLESPQKSLPKSQLCRRPLTGGVAKHDPPK